MSEVLMYAVPAELSNLTLGPVALCCIPPPAQLRPAHTAVPVGLRVCDRDVLLTPSPHHIWLAGIRLRAGLLQWAAQEHAGMSAEGAGLPEIAMLVADPPTRAQLRDALTKGAIALSLPNADVVSARLDRLTLDFAPIEALRERLFEKAKALIRILTALRGREPGQERLIRQCGLMLISGLSKMQIRLHEADTCITDVLDALRNIESAHSLLHSCSISIGVNQDQWAHMLALWDDPNPQQSRALILSQTHAFLITVVMGHTT